MSKIKVRWLWIVVGCEIVAIAGILIWGLAMRQPKNAPVQTPATQQQPQKPTYNTPKVELKKIADGFAKPVTIVNTGTQNDKRLFVVEQDGKIRVATTGGSVAPEPFLDLSSKVKTGGEMGLLGLAFHPKLAENPYFYVDYVDKNQNTIVARYTIKNMSEESWGADSSSEKVLLKIKQPYANHNGGGLAFGPDGYLYIGMGDGGSHGDPQNRAQNRNELLGKLLRIDVDGGDPYSSPKDNMFASGGGRAEIWAMGLRNPWRFSFDRKTGDLYIADVGQGDWEEINFKSAASKADLNYGWRCYEGSHKFNTAGCQAASTYINPIIEYNHDDGRCSVTGGYVYRGTAFPALDGKYFYGDYCTGDLYYTEQVSGMWDTTPVAQTGHRITTFGEDSAGELYMASYKSGTIFQITDTANQ